MNKAVIVAAKRTPIGKYGGIFRDVQPEILAAQVIKAIMSECKIQPSEIDDVVLGNAVGPGGNLARLSALTAGLPVEIPGVTIDRQCGSGLEAINYAARMIQAGAGEIYLAGGVESSSRVPWRIEKPQSLYQLQPPEFYSRARFSPEELGDPEMGMAAENVAQKYKVTREEQDQYAFLSHQKATSSSLTGRYKKEIVPIEVQTKEGTEKYLQDECPRYNTSLEKLASLPPIFQEGGTVTAGNACPINDGAAIVLIMSEARAIALGLKPLLSFVDSSVAGVDPNYLGIGPVPAVQKLLERQQLSVHDIDLVEFNEAFASQVIASLKELQIPWHKVNVGGGALALGHPYGASGAILVTRLCTEMKEVDINRGLVTLGIGGGIGIATLFEKEMK